jgi:hypothetical protein
MLQFYHIALRAEREFGAPVSGSAMFRSTALFLATIAG